MSPMAISRKSFPGRGTNKCQEPKVSMQPMCSGAAGVSVSGTAVSREWPETLLGSRWRLGQVRCSGVW